jgi:hypothetical protein
MSRSFWIQFFIMFLVGVCFNPMNVLAYDFSHLYLSYTLIYSGLLMASNMVWSHELVHYFSHGHFNKMLFGGGLFVSVMIGILLLRGQLFVDEKQWLRRMIGHHSTALTTTRALLKNNDLKDNSKVYRLAKDIIYKQEQEILFMQRYL